jgi:hypothetical protein
MRFFYLPMFEYSLHEREEGIGSPGGVSSGEGGYVPPSLRWPSDFLVAPGSRDAYFCSALLDHVVLVDPAIVVASRGVVSCQVMVSVL